MKFARIPAGSFDMGSDSKSAYDQSPVHRVTIGRPFELQTTEVTQAQWVAVMGTNPSHFQGDDRPVERVSWNDAQQFIAKLNERDPGKNYRLPTEAEWEYACRAGTSEARYGEIERIAWYDANSNGQTHPVGTKEPNAWGLYDMLGNIQELCVDERVERTGTWTPALVYKGGNIVGGPLRVRPAARNPARPLELEGGFRVVRERTSR